MRALNFGPMKRSLLIVLLLMMVGPTWGQGLMQRKRRDIIPLEGQALRIGFYFAPGITYTLPQGKDEEREVYRNADTLFTAAFEPKGRFGAYFEAGLAWYTRDPVIVDYLDLGIAYKGLRGAEAFAGTYAIGNTAVPLAGDGIFKDDRLTIHFNANKFIPTWRYQFVQLSLGANADLRLSGSREYTGALYYNDVLLPHSPGHEVSEGPEPSAFTDPWAQLHFKLGYGFKVSGTLLIIPAIETPIFGVRPDDEGRFGAMRWLNSEHRPLILSVRFLFLRARKGFDCPPPIKHNAFEGGKTKKYKPDSYHP